MFAVLQALINSVCGLGGDYILSSVDEHVHHIYILSPLAAHKCTKRVFKCLV